MKISLRRVPSQTLLSMCKSAAVPMSWITRKLLLLVFLSWNVVFLLVFFHFCIDSSTKTPEALTRDVLDSAVKSKLRQSGGRKANLYQQFEIDLNICNTKSLGLEYKENTADSEQPSCRLPKTGDELCKEILSHFRSVDNNICIEKETRIFSLQPQWGEENALVDLWRYPQDDLCNGQKKYIGYIQPDSGVLQWETLLEKDNLTKTFAAVLRKCQQSSASFILIRCGDRPHVFTQLLPLPPSLFLHRKQSDTPKTFSKSVNINLVLLDSVSRPHFFRSLPHTVQAIKKINSQRKGSFILDFELYQAVKARTYENLYTLFAGEIPEKTSNDSIVSPLPVHKLFKYLQSSGYQTLWQEDLCWSNGWGLVRNLKVHDEDLPPSERWRGLKQSCLDNGIDNLGLTHASCEILSKYGLLDPFLHPEKICFNGKFHHEYMLEYLRDSFLTRNKEIHKALFALSIFNTPHENSGLRLQTMDQSLKAFVQDMARSQDTVTVIFSDHGNTYGPYPNTIHGRYEQFNPSLFIIIPDKVQKQIGHSAMLSLQQNQRKLLTILDLRNILMDMTNLGKPASEGHTFHPIPHNRSCDSILIMDSALCICEGWSSRVVGNPMHTLLAEFALSQLNALIDKQKAGNQIVKGNAFSSCQRLVATEVREVYERRGTVNVVIQMDLVVQYQEMFSVKVEMMLKGNSSITLKLKSFTRLSTYGVFRLCRDPRVDANLCVCDKNKKYEDSMSKYRDPFILHWEDVSPVFGVQTQANEMHRNCLYILTREHTGGIVFEATCTCPYFLYRLNVKFDVVNLRIADFPEEVAVLPGSIVFLTILVPADPGSSWRWKYQANYSWEQL